MRPRPKRPWSGKTAGTNIHNINVYICDGCSGWYRHEKPAQCDSCGMMTFTLFHSIAEAKRYGELRLEERAGLVTDVELQPRFQLDAVCFSTSQDEPKYWVHKVGHYIADFKYHRHGEGIKIEDVKGGADTHLSAWKRKHAEGQYGIKIDIITR